MPIDGDDEDVFYDLTQEDEDLVPRSVDRLFEGRLSFWGSSDEDLSDDDFTRTLEGVRGQIGRPLSWGTVGAHLNNEPVLMMGQRAYNRLLEELRAGRIAIPQTEISLAGIRVVSDPTIEPDRVYTLRHDAPEMPFTLTSPERTADVEGLIRAYQMGTVSSETMSYLMGLQMVEQPPEDIPEPEVPTIWERLI